MTKENPSQEKAVRHGKGPCMVLAGPGSGKTTVITHRVEYLTEELAVDPWHILVITFTRAAAEEMKNRYLKLSGQASSEVTFGTFHAVFFNMLRVRYHLQESGILKEYEKRRILNEVIREHFPEVHTDRVFLDSLIGEISKVKNNRLDPAAFHSANGRVPFRKVYACYANKVRERGCLDYDDMLLLTYDLLVKDRETLEFWRKKYRWILIDEYQDINPVQFDVIRLIAEPENNLFIVGDDDQSVYRFRNASPELMLQFPKYYRKVKKVQLDINYRCGSRIVQQSEHLIRHNKKRYQKKTKACGDAKGEVLTRIFETPEEECREVASVIVKRHEEAGIPFEEIAVLFRTNGSAETLISALTEAKIPFFSRGHVENLFRHPVCGPVYAYLNLALGDRSRKNFLKCMNAPVRYIRRTDLIEEEVDPEQLKELYRIDPNRAWMEERISCFQYQIGLLKKLKTPFAMINYIRKGMEYDRYVLEQAAGENAYPARRPEMRTGITQETSEQMGILDALQASAAPFSTVKEWYSHIAAYTKELENTEKERNADGAGKVLLSTLHGAKGLEFDTVIMIDLNERVIPHDKAVTPEDLEEERRLFYVGMTRAKRLLVLCCAKERFGKKTEPSRFLKEL